MAKQKSEIMETIALEQVPPEQKKSWTSIAFIWAGSVICVPALMVGGMIGAGLPFWQATAAMLLGYLISVVIMFFSGAQSSDVGLPSVIALSRGFGQKGSAFIVSTIIAVCMTCWFGFQTTLCAGAFNSIMLQYFNLEIPFWISAIVWGGLMLLTAVYGITLIKILNQISVPLLFILLIFGMVKNLAVPGTWEQVLSYQPEQPISFIAALTLAFGGFATGPVICGDYTRYCKSRGDAVKAVFVGVIPAGVGVLVIGGIMTVLSGSYDLTVSLANLGYPFLGLAVLILATWTTNTGNAYSAAFSVMNLFRIKDEKRSLVTLIVGLIGITLSILGILDYFSPFLNVLSAVLPAVASVAIADYWIVGKGNKENFSAYEGVRRVGVIAWALGAGFALLFPNFFVPAINSLVVSFVAYIVLFYTLKPTAKDLEQSGQDSIFNAAKEG